MSGTHMNNEQEHRSPRESGEDSEDESEILEESPCGRWLKRREEAFQSLSQRSTSRDVHVATVTTADASNSRDVPVETVTTADASTSRDVPVETVTTADASTSRDVPVEPVTTAGASTSRDVHKETRTVEQRDVPGIDCAFLAMDMEEGVEVVWNEVQFSERKNFKNQEEKIQMVFENLTQLDHPNIVKFHRYWTDTHNDKPRVIFITEYMSSGSLKQFLKRTKRNVKRLPLPAWRRWCTQILSALSYLHSCSPPIIHGNLTCDTIFIQHNGLVKIGSVAPDSINHHVKTCDDDFKNLHFIAPEHPVITPALDIYAFGMCALEMAALEIIGNGDSGKKVTEENIRQTIDLLEDESQKDFIEKCLRTNPNERWTAKDLLFHPLLFEVHSLKLLAAHVLVRNSANISETITDELMQRWYGPEVIVAEIVRKNGENVQMKMTDVPVNEKLEKFVEDVKNGIYPLTAFGAKQPPPARSRAISPEMAESVKSVTPEPTDVETRKIINMMCDVKSKEESCDLLLTIVLRMDDKMNRQLTSCISPGDNPKVLAQELVHYGFVNEIDRDKIAALIEDTLQTSSGPSSPTHKNNYHEALPESLTTLPAAQTVTSLPTVNSAPTQVPMHTTS